MHPAKMTHSQPCETPNFVVTAVAIITVQKSKPAKAA
jgi:hypothetical protein